MVVSAQRISTDAYQALREALTYMLWYKQTFRPYLNTALRDAPELLAEIDWSVTKREIVDVVVDRLMERERRYQDLTLGLMLDVAGRTDFREIDGCDHPDWAVRGRAAVAEMKRLVAVYEPLYRHRQEAAAEEEAGRARRESQRRFSDELDALRADFFALAADPDLKPQKRGIKFEKFLNRLFQLFDLEPRFAYSLEHEQLDGAFSFDTDDYIVEAKWRKTPVARHEADSFTMKVGRKGRNALGLMVSIDGFTADTIAVYSTGTTFITMDGADLMAVLNGHYRLEEMLRRKKRHMNEEGACHFPVRDF